MLHVFEQSRGGPILGVQQETRHLQDVLRRGPLPGLIIQVGHVEAAKKLNGKLLPHHAYVIVVQKEVMHNEPVVPPLLLLLLRLCPFFVVSRTANISEGMHFALWNLGLIQGQLVEVKGVQLEGISDTLHANVVYEAALIFDLLGNQPCEGLTDQNLAPVELRALFEAHSQVDVGTEVRGVNLELRAYGTLDGPAAVKTEAHAHAVVREALCKLGVLTVLLEQRGGVDVGDYLDERDQGHVREALLLAGAVLREAPGQEEGVPDVLVGAAEVLVDAGVHHARNAVDEDHNLILQDLGGVSEVAYVAKTEDPLHPPTRDHGVQSRAGLPLHVLADDLGASLAEAKGQQRADLDDRLL
mmetsp:Transcript_17770/g.51856  ORF Transcript_17770/g.51856 Transcript_17770/m.51856 type:complete len:356 (+) Transcript_17770:202-1269(+)